MRWIGKMAAVLAVLIVIVAAAGCGGERQDDAQEEIGWRTLSLPQDDGRSLSLELPGELEVQQERSDDANVKNQKIYKHLGSRMLVSIHHGTMINPNVRVKFTMSRFLDDFAKVRKNNPVLKRAEKRTINGREMDYFEIGLRDEDGDSLRLECLGLQMGQEYWMITFGYWTDDKTMEAIAEKAMASIRIE
ncbi:hypothetical protein SAMN02910356_00548 [Selenomonas sp. GACV-9]|nr:hypothetical protein SAMN02910356_00548 [Selenomonas ruminantium]